MTETTPTRIAVLDDFQNVALSMADWSAVTARAEVTVFNDHLADPDAVIERLRPFDAICVMRERTPLPRRVLKALPRLRLVASTGPGNAAIDVKAADELGIKVVHTGYSSTATIEFTWALILAAARNIAIESRSVRSGGWQRMIGGDLKGKTLGVLGLGNIGGPVARIGQAFEMEVVAWSENLTAGRAGAVGVEPVDRDELFRRSDILTIHLVLSRRTRGLVGERELALMKPTALLVNASRGPIVVEADLISALERGTIAGAAIDVFEQEPLPVDHPFRKLPQVLATPHIGYVSHDLYRTFYGDTVANLEAWLDERGPTGER